MSQAKERAENHWDHYVGPMQRVILEQMVEMCMSIGRFHYISSHIHGVKHAEQDADEVARGALANGAARKARSLCDSCADNHECGITAVGGRPKTCVEHRPSLCDSEVEEISTFCGYYAPFGDKCTLHTQRGLADCGGCADFRSVTVGAANAS